ncbi:2-oxo acid dehydrogenase subunit E2 [Micromonospora sp. DSM 115977]|uniref:Dihydrolipoamide acetyltransferase component of pyruvate dehydrogenase complex n=1 Tax=Micromonospora reichwaldensis TaxID=3075516 RepID=A0ABU2WU49_9ACTN|nr:2-oxo acid dehydrogenase subunit E2 [Micromonospora sp. DSM 115977]MDT0529058.1 2-oxo acid dehydrogenase subunit E2 [Micromonospora sp. DSM 115977]
MGDIRLPRLNATDEEYTLIEWLVGDGAPVEAGTAVALVETSKAAHELVADDAGILWQRTSAPSTCRPGEVVATVGGDDRPPPAQRTADPDSITITEPARRLMAEHGVAEAAVRSIGKPVIARSDIEQLVAGQAPPTTVERVTVSAAQRRVARTVSTSHREIPAAYAVVKVVADRLKQRLRAEAATIGFVGIPELVVEAIAAQRAEFPLCFARAESDQAATVRPGAHVGVTIDVGRGLYLPVVADADTRPLRDIAADLLRFRRAAVRGEFAEADLAGSNIALTIHTDADVVHAQPLIFPEHTCAVSLASMQRELVLQNDGSVTTSDYFHLGLAYDHRFVNGRSAVAFLRAVKADLEAG